MSVLIELDLDRFHLDTFSFFSIWLLSCTNDDKDRRANVEKKWREELNEDDQIVVEL